VDWWPLLSARENYADDAPQYRSLLQAPAKGKVRDVVEFVGTLAFVATRQPDALV
jgi:hypothetical protein